MRLASVLDPITPQKLAWAAQCGVTDVVTHYPGAGIEPLRQVQQQIADAGMQLSVIEGMLPLERIKLGIDDGSELTALQQLIRDMGQLGIPILCYNFMAGTDWVRTRLDSPQRGGARVTAFDLEQVRQAQLLGHAGPDGSERGITVDELWTNLTALLNAIVPVAEEHGVQLAMHPDDPPLDELLGNARIMNSLDSFEQLMQLKPSPANGICFCQGTFAEIGVDIPSAIRRLGPHIRYVHFRDVQGQAENFAETFHDNGKTNMPEAIRTYREIGYTGPLRPDHVPQLDGEEDGEPGYTMLGRLYAYGYIRGLLQATE